GPMVIAFEGAYGGHAIGTYNRQLQLLWAGARAHWRLPVIVLISPLCAR
ncbi:hypothetical protein MJN92_11480, partial [Salmonella enterica subsp. enterica serovar Anatum]|nr:hypothetical protein [Salmonella enterica subsp. enterica serovar Anatum]